MKREKLIIIISFICLIIIIFLLYRFFTLFSEKESISISTKQEIVDNYDKFKVEFDKAINYHFDLNNSHDYEKTMKKLYKVSKPLEKLCIKEYKDTLANSTCEVFKTNYEAITNYYINDTLENKNLSLTKYEDYIDYDNDGKYFGKGDAP